MTADQAACAVQARLLQAEAAWLHAAVLLAAAAAPR